MMTLKLRPSAEAGPSEPKGKKPAMPGTPDILTPTDTTSDVTFESDERTRVPELTQARLSLMRRTFECEQPRNIPEAQLRDTEPSSSEQKILAGVTAEPVDNAEPDADPYGYDAFARAVRDYVRVLVEGERFLQAKENAPKRERTWLKHVRKTAFEYRRVELELNGGLTDVQRDIYLSGDLTELGSNHDDEPVVEDEAELDDQPLGDDEVDLDDESDPDSRHHQEPHRRDGRWVHAQLRFDVAVSTRLRALTDDVQACKEDIAAMRREMNLSERPRGKCRNRRHGRHCGERERAASDNDVDGPHNDYGWRPGRYPGYSAVAGSLR